MLDIKFIRENKEIITEGARKKRINFNVEELLEEDKKRLSILAEVESLRSEQNKMSEKIARSDDPRGREIYIDTMKVVIEQLKEKEVISFYFHSSF